MVQGFRLTPQMYSRRYVEFEQDEWIDDFHVEYPETAGISTKGVCYYSSMYWLRTFHKTQRYVGSGQAQHGALIGAGVDALNYQLRPDKFKKVLRGQAAYDQAGRRVEEALPGQQEAYRQELNRIQSKVKLKLHAFAQQVAQSRDLAMAQQLDKQADKLVDKGRSKMAAAEQQFRKNIFRRIGDVDVPLYQIEIAEKLNMHFTDGWQVKRGPGFGEEIVAFTNKSGYFILEFGQPAGTGFHWFHVAAIKVFIGNFYRMVLYDPNMGVFTTGNQRGAIDLVTLLLSSYIETDDNSFTYSDFAVLKVAIG